PAADPRRPHAGAVRRGRDVPCRPGRHLAGRRRRSPLARDRRRLVQGQGPRVRIELPAWPEFVTVSVELKRGTTTIGFGTRTFMPLSEDEAARVAVLIDLREMAMTDEPSSPMVSAAHDPLERQELLSPVPLPHTR